MKIQYGPDHLKLSSSMDRRLIGSPNEFWVLKIFKDGNEEIPYRVHTSKSYSYLQKIKKRYG